MNFVRSGVEKFENSKIFETLHQYFGYTSFRPLQKEIIQDVLARKDVFVLMPTGGGKSLCYQLPALLQEGVTIVVSPLISLMKDQVDGLEANGIPAACMNSTQSSREIRDVKTAFLEKRIKILYVAPERLMMSGTLALLKKGKVNLFAIDEAHCISEWGHDFRPEYRKLKLLRDKNNGFPGVPVIALTATATERVRKDIISQLGLKIDPEKGPYVASFNRKNLYYEVRPKKETFSEILDYLKKHRGEAGIIYCQSRSNVEALTKKLIIAGFRALPYHAGLSDSERSRNQEQFIKDDVDIIIATIAFGMGIDKSNVRFVIHYDLPRNLESYYQETGRGGRDGGPCECILFFSRGDRFKIEYFISQKTNEKEKDVALVQLRQMVAYCESNKCRRQMLLEYFGEKASGACGNCDVCLNPKQTFDGTQAAKKLLTCVKELNQRFGTNYVIDILTGSRTNKIKTNHHDRLKSHGCGREFTKTQWKGIVSEMTATGLLDISGARYPLLKLNALSRKILQGSEQVELTCPAGFVPDVEGVSQIPETGVKDDKVEADDKKVTNGAGKVTGTVAGMKADKKGINAVEDFPAVTKAGVSGGGLAKKDAKIEKLLKNENTRKTEKTLDEPAPILFERLKALRKKIAIKRNLPPYIIFSDTSLKEMASKLPRNSEEFHSITGVGDYKLQKYGAPFLHEIENYCLDYGLATSENENCKAPVQGIEASKTEPDKTGACKKPEKGAKTRESDAVDHREGESYREEESDIDIGKFPPKTGFSEHKGKEQKDKEQGGNEQEGQKHEDKGEDNEQGEDKGQESRGHDRTAIRFQEKVAGKTRYLDTSIEEWSNGLFNRGLDDLRNESGNRSESNESRNEIGNNGQRESRNEIKNNGQKEPRNEIENNEQNEPGHEFLTGSEQKSEKNSIDESKFEKEQKISSNISPNTSSPYYKGGLKSNGIPIEQNFSANLASRQLEQLVITGKVREIEGIIEENFPPEKQQLIKKTVLNLEKEIDSIIRSRLGNGSTEEEVRFAKALLTSKYLLQIL